MAKVLVLGGTGFLGRWLVRCAPGSIAREDILTAGRRPIPDAPEGTHVVVDLAMPGAVKNLIERTTPSVVFMAAGRRRGTFPDLLAAEFAITVSLLAASPPTRTRVVITGSSAEIGPSDGRRTRLDEEAPARPVTAYGHAKLAETWLARAWSHHTSVVTARLFNLIGPGLPEGLVPADLAKQVVEAEKSRGRVVVGRTDSVRDFVDVRDASDAMWKLALSSETGLFHVGSGKGTRVGDLAAMFLSEAKGACSLVEQDAHPTPADVDWQVADCGKIRTRVGWEPRIPLAQSVRNMLDALRG